MSNALKAAAESVFKGVAKNVEVAGRVAGEVSESAGNLAISTSKIAENAGKIAEEITGKLLDNTGKLTDNAGKIAVQGTEAGKEAAKALTHVVSVATNLTSAANSLAERAENSIKKANERRAIIEKEKNEILNATSSIKTETKITEETKRLEQQKQEIIKNAEVKKQQIENELLEETKNNEIERTKIEAEAQKIKKEFENAQLILAQTQQVAEINTYIGTRFGYKDSDCTKVGWNSSTFSSKKKNFYMVIGIMDIKTNTYLQVKFNKESGKDGYYVNKDGYIYKLQIIPNVETRTSLITRKPYYKELPSFAKIIHVKYTPNCFADEGSVNPNNANIDPEVDMTKYSIMTKLEEFIDYSRGGTKAKKTKSRNKKTIKKKRSKKN
uniref:Uncharacterized protein n=1 Tax=viral metagenome TaxID=1070528 RepID=A0A6C0L6S1_9ZZZZ